jgi:hypothetical protein
MKEQLAKMTIIELVRTAHSYSTSIKQTGVYSELVREMASRLEALNLAHIGAMAALSSTENDRDQLAAENAQMLRLLTDISENHDEYVNQDEYLYAGVPMDYVSEINTYVSRDVNAENPFKATDRFLAEQRAQGRVEGINYAAGRLAAAYNHGFVDKPLTEVGDVVRMILDARDELTRALIPAADGLSGEYAEKALKEWEAQLRNEVNV